MDLPSIQVFSATFFEQKLLLGRMQRQYLQVSADFLPAGRVFGICLEGWVVQK